jgi:hypothetical protein
MFCQKCGTALAATATACLACNTPQAGAAGSRSAAAANVKAAWTSALGTLRCFAADPVGRLPAAYEALGDGAALRVGLVYGAVSVLCFLLGGYLLLPFKDELFDFLGFGGVVKCVLFALVPFGGTALGSLAARKLAGGANPSAGLGADLFTAGAALLPVSLAMPLNGMLGYENYAAMALLSVFAGCTSILMLHAAFTRIAKHGERVATLAIPTVAVLVFWLGKLLASSVLEGSFGGGYGGGDFGPAFDMNGFGGPGFGDFGG